MTRTPGPTVRRLIDAYEPGFRATLTVARESVEDLTVLTAAAADLPEDAARLLEALTLVTWPGESLPERLRAQIEREGLPLWRAALLVPRASATVGSDIHPLRYAGSCRLNPALRSWLPPGLPPVTDEATASFPPSDARFDAIVVAAQLESQPGQLTQDGALRKDVEKRLFGGLSSDAARWSLALQVARLTGLVRASEGRLRGFPEAVPRSIGDPTALFGDPAQVAACALLLRLTDDRWIDVPALLERLRVRARQILWSPLDGRYPDRDRAFDEAGWANVEVPLFLDVIDTLHRAGTLDVARVGLEIRALRKAGPRPMFAGGFMLTPDNDILVHVGDLSPTDYGRLCRLAPFVDGERMHRHRLSREGVAADIAAGNRDTMEFLAQHSRTGLPPSTADAVREWSRSATRIVVLTGIDVEEDERGNLRLATGAPAATVVDYSKPPRARFLYRRGQLIVPAGWDALTVRAAVARVARYQGREGEDHVFVPELRRHADPGPLLDRLREHFGGELPGEIETLVLSGTGLPAVEVERAFLVRLPAQAAAAIRRDWVAAPLLRRAVTQEEVVVLAEDLPRLRARLAELGLGWTGPEGA